MALNLTISDEIINLCTANNVSWLGMFGSTARNEADLDSDIDILVRFSKKNQPTKTDPFGK